MSGEKCVILTLLFVIAIPASISTFTNGAFAVSICNKSSTSCADTNVIPKAGCCTVAAVSGIHTTSSGMLKDGPGALTSNIGVTIIANPSANVNPGGHTIAKTSGQSAHTPP